MSRDDRSIFYLILLLQLLHACPGDKRGETLPYPACLRGKVDYEEVLPSGIDVKKFQFFWEATLRSEGLACKLIETDWDESEIKHGP